MSENVVVTDERTTVVVSGETDTVVVSDETVTVVSVGLPGPAGVSLAGKLLIVDSVNGSDATGVRGRLDLTYATPAGALADAATGDTIIVYPGAYTVTTHINVTGVLWFLLPGASMTAGVGGILPVAANTIDLNTPVIPSTFSNDGVNFTVPQTRRLIQCFDQSSGHRIGSILVGNTGLATDFFGWAFYGVDDIGALPAGSETLLGGFSGYGTMVCVGDLVTGWDKQNANDNAGNYMAHSLYVGVQPTGTDPELAMLYARMASNPSGTPTNLVDLRKTDNTAGLVIDPNGKVFLSGLPTSDPHAVGQLWKSGTTLMVSAG